MPSWQLPGGEDHYYRDLQDWIESAYDYRGSAEFALAKEDSQGAVRMVGKLLRYRPEERVGLKGILDDEWFRD